MTDVRLLMSKSKGFVAGVIGYRNHSLNIINILKKNNLIKKIIIFCYKKKNLNQLIFLNNNKKIYYTNNFSELKNADFHFITSPTQTHLTYIKKLIPYNKKIFCEKPGLKSVQDYNYLKKIDNKFKKNIFFNYNLIHSKLFKLLKYEMSKSKKNRIINISIYSTIGISFLKKFENNWRFITKNILERITGNLGVHHVNFSLNLFSGIKKILITEKCVARKNKIDTSSIYIKFKNNSSVNMFLSYATPATDRYEYYFNHKIIVCENSKIYSLSPRNYFDKNGLFTRPPKKLIHKFNKSIGQDSIHSSVEYFLKIASEKKNFPLNYFENAINTAMVFLKKY